MNKKLWISLGTAAALVVLAVFGANMIGLRNENGDSNSQESQTANLISEQHENAYAMIAVDINPSFEIFVNPGNKVLEISAINDDAKTIDVSGLVGMKADEAVLALIALATDAGFINEEDTADDYVLVTTVVLDDEESEEESDEYQDNLENEIEEEVNENDEIGDTVKVALMKATKRELFEAQDKKIPLGLYVINGMVENEDGTLVKVNEFVKERNNLKQLEHRAEIAEKHSNKGKDDESEISSSILSASSSIDDENEDEDEDEDENEDEDDDDDYISSTVSSNNSSTASSATTSSSSSSTTTSSGSGSSTASSGTSSSTASSSVDLVTSPTV